MDELDFITYNDVTFDYDENDEDSERAQNERPAVAHVSFTVSQGDFVCIIGRNGSGKSTIARLMNGLLIPTEGTVFVGGLDTKDEEKIWDIRSTTGMVFQNPDNQIIGTTVEEDVAFGAENLGIPHDEMVERVSQAIDGCGLTEYKTVQPHLLSGGQKQRVAIAGILAMKPRCIVLDESTAMLDPKGRKDVLEIVRKLNREGITIVLITHHMEEIVGADEVILVDNGNVIKEGKPADLFKDAELIKKCGLDLPMTAKLFNELKNEGLNVPDAVLTENDALEFISSRIKEN